ncbi:DUF1206 domain-containing protein [Sphingomonas sp. LT1P40]|uniref:DUF1206 domain-containing protein n=1 Tax=Alteristakelama amylovorans TaxID=3096166 RepID=UPI002FC6EF56
MPAAKTFELLTRAGFAARGIMYILIGYLALRLGRTEDGAGALEWMNSGGGQFVLIAMAIGFLAYALWRLSEAAIDSEGHGSDAKGIAVRVGGAVSGAIHLSLAWLALKLGTGGHGDDGDAAEQGASTVLALPGGELALVVGAAILLATGAYQIVKAIKLGFLKHIDPAVSGKSWITWLGRAGYLARGAVFVVMALFLWRASRQSSADAAGGMGQAMDVMPASAQIVVAAGLLMFGVFSLVEARYRRINDPDVVKRLKRFAA